MPTDDNETKDDAENNPGNGDDNETEKEGASLSDLEVARKAKEDSLKELLYARAEFDNYKKRILREQDQAVKFANEKLISDLIPVADLFERALQHTASLKSRGEDKEVSNFVMGIEMTHKELTNVLGRFGVEFTGTAGEKFDPNCHEAIAQRPDPSAEAGTVLEVFQRGCLYQGRLLKPARVVVAE